MDIRTVLESGSKKIGGRGSKKKRSDVKELLMLWILKRKSPIGRYRLKYMLGLSEHEGVVRQMLEEFQKQGYVSASRSGCVLTDRGKSFLENRLRSYYISARAS